MRLGDGAVTQPEAHVPSESNVTQRSLSEIDSRIVQLERQLAGSDADSSGSELEIDSVALQRASARKDGKAVAAAPAAKRPREGTAPPAPAEEVAGVSLHCELCGVSVTSQALMREHLRGRKHRDAARFKEAACEGRFCATCGLAFTSAAQLKEHCNGKTHRSRLAAGAGKGGKGGGAGKGGKGGGAGKGGKGGGAGKGGKGGGAGKGGEGGGAGKGGKGGGAGKGGKGGGAGKGGKGGGAGKGGGEGGGEGSGKGGGASTGSEW